MVVEKGRLLLLNPYKRDSDDNKQEYNEVNLEEVLKKRAEKQQVQSDLLLLKCSTGST